MTSLVEQIKEALVAFAGLRTPPALIGGLALAAHNVVRATRDVDFLVDADDADPLHHLLLELGIAASTAARTRPTTFAARRVWTCCTRTARSRDTFWRMPVNGTRRWDGCG